ncbi:MAG: glycoside hydrolase family 28 protein [Bacteroidetes bacterium]|nr:glycoside hydrolase family 28 protein [Bacteroidota bacterium]MBS1930168.1 glycoside hydrolase family 28 protein [Bacteroidota bacterium]
MKRSFTVLVFIIGGKMAFGQQKDLRYYFAQAPFTMPEVTEPIFPSKMFYIKDYGAVNDGETLNTTAFTKAIDACSEAGGGTVLVPAGTWLTGPFKMKSNVNLHTEKNTLVLFTPDRNQYPIVRTSKESSNFIVQSPISGNNLQNIAITGEGVFDGSGESWRPVKKSKLTHEQWGKLLASGGVLSPDGKTWWPSEEAMNGDAYLKSLKDKKNLTEKDFLPARDFLRPRMIVFTNCNNVLLDGPTFRNSPMYVFYPNHCTNLTIRNVTVHNEYWAQNGDGIDISACKGVVIYKTIVSAGDDGICMKSSGGKEPDGFELENVLIAGCIVYQSHGGFVIGSNTDGGMRNIFVSDCDFIGSDIGIRVKSNAGRGGVVKDIYMQNINMQNIINAAVSFDTYYENLQLGVTVDTSGRARNKIPDFRDFHFSNINCEGAKSAIYINGLPEMPVHRIFFENMNITANTGATLNAAADLEFKNVKIIPKKGPVYTLSNSRNIHIANGFLPPDTDKFLVTKENVSDVIVSGTKLRDKSKNIELGKGGDKNSVIVGD